MAAAFSQGPIRLSLMSKILMLASTPLAVASASTEKQTTAAAFTANSLGDAGSLTVEKKRPNAVVFPTDDDECDVDMLSNLFAARLDLLAQEAPSPEEALAKRRKRESFLAKSLNSQLSLNAKEQKRLF